MGLCINIFVGEVRRAIECVKLDTGIDVKLDTGTLVSNLVTFGVKLVTFGLRLIACVTIVTFGGMLAKFNVNLGALSGGVGFGDGFIGGVGVFGDFCGDTDTWLLLVIKLGLVIAMVNLGFDSFGFLDVHTSREFCSEPVLVTVDDWLIDGIWGGFVVITPLELVVVTMLVIVLVTSIEVDVDVEALSLFIWIGKSDRDIDTILRTTHTTQN